MGKLLLLAALLLLHASLLNAKPTFLGANSRVKRVSDQRLAELETLIGLQRMHGKLVTVPVAGGVLDIKQIGRKRRSQNQLLTRLFNSSEEDDANEEVEYMLRATNLLRELQRRYDEQQRFDQLELERLQQLDAQHNYAQNEEKLDPRIFYVPIR